jgi:Xaa-Pro aminopeptidase
VIESPLERFQQKLREAAIDWAVVGPGYHLQYLTGLRTRPSRRLTLAFIPQSGKIRVVLPALETDLIRSAEALDAEVNHYRDGESPLLPLRSAMRQADRIGADFANLRLWEWDAVREAGYEAMPMDISPFVWALRRIKTADEIEKIRIAQRMSETAMEAAVQIAKPGVSEKQLAKLIGNLILDAGADGVSFNPFVASGANAASPHHSPTDKPIEPGELFIVDCGAYRDGFAGDVTRTFCFGEPSPELARIAEAATLSTEAAVAVTRAGVKACDVDAAARGVLQEFGLPDYPHSSGHAIGAEADPPHEPPRLTPTNQDVLQAGMVLTIEPGVYVHGVGGARVEDAVVVEEDGNENLCRLPRHLIRL